MPLSCPVPYNKLLMDDAGCSSDEVVLPKQVINHYMEHSVRCAKALNKDIRAIAMHLEEYADMKEDFIDAFPEWEGYRKTSIACLANMIEELDSIHFNTNIAKTTATAGGIICGCVALASGVAMVLGHSSASPLRLAACIGGLVSSATSNGATATEACLSVSYINKAKQLLREDLEHFDAIREWFKHSENLKSAIERVCKYNAMVDIFQKLIMIVPQVKNACDTFSSQVNEVIEQVVKVVAHKNLSHDDIEKIVLLCISVCRDPELLENIRNCFQIIQNEPSVLPLVTMFVKVPVEMKFLLNHIFNSDVKSSTNRNMSTHQAVTYGLFQAVNVALELVSLSFLIGDFQNGSPSKYAVGIREVRDQLKLQLELVSGVYKKLKNTK